MSTLTGSFRRRLAWWLPALLVLLLALAALIAYPLRFASRAQVTQEELAEARQELAALSARHQRAAARVAEIAGTRKAVDSFYHDRLSTESARLTRILAEVKDLASRAGLAPSQITYPSEALEDYGLRRRGIVFQVDGTYADLRKLINLLELSDSFLTLEKVDLSDVSGGRLRIQLRLSTLFSIDGKSPLEGT